MGLNAPLAPRKSGFGRPFSLIDAGTCSTPRRFLSGALYFFTCKKRKS